MVKDALGKFKLMQVKSDWSIHFWPDLDSVLSATVPLVCFSRAGSQKWSTVVNFHGSLLPSNKTTF